MLVQPALAWGVLDLATDGSGPMTRLGVRSKKPAAKSSTMRGAKALASKIHVRRCRTANGSG